MTDPTRDELAAAAERVEDFFTRRPAESTAGELCSLLSDARKVTKHYLAEHPAEPVSDGAIDELARLRDENERFAAECADIVRQYQAQARIDMDEIAALKRGEFICSKCGLRKDGEESNQPVTF